MNHWLNAFISINHNYSSIESLVALVFPYLFDTVDGHSTFCAIHYLDAGSDAVQSFGQTPSESFGFIRQILQLDSSEGRVQLVFYIFFWIFKGEMQHIHTLECISPIKMRRKG